MGDSKVAMKAITDLFHGVLQIYSATLEELERLRGENAHLRQTLADSERPAEGD